MRTIVLSLVAAFLAGCISTAAKPRGSTRRDIDAAVARLMQREGVNGLALAQIDGGKVAMVAAYGFRNVKNRLPLTTTTVMYVASLTKTAFAYMAMQLVDERRLDLDTPFAKLLPKPLPDYEEFADLRGDERWRLLTPRHVLTHTTGFANFRWLEPDRRLRIHHVPGSRYTLVNPEPERTQ